MTRNVRTPIDPENNSPHAPSAKQPPVDEVCRILARVLNRVSADASVTLAMDGEVGR